MPIGSALLRTATCALHLDSMRKAATGLLPIGSLFAIAAPALVRLDATAQDRRMPLLRLATAGAVLAVIFSNDDADCKGLEDCTTT